MLLIDNDVIERLRQLEEYAQQHIFSMDEMLDVSNGQAPAAGAMKEFTCLIPVGFKVVFAIESQPAGYIRHLSVSLGDGRRAPSVPVVVEIMKMLGFKTNLLEKIDTKICFAKLEEFRPGCQAVNVWEIMSEHKDIEKWNTTIR